MKKPVDDWGTPLGADPEAEPPTVKKGDSLVALVDYFRSLLPTDAWGRINSPVNAPALMAGLKRLREAGHTPEQIRGMMVSFIANIKRTPLPVGVAPWRGFLANLDSLANSVVTQEADYDDIELDGRLR
ncbi:hypothetical protein EBT31_16145 [bacterium]|nr:hypothetical protein [bacterium]